MHKNTWQYKNKYKQQILKGNTHDLIITLFLQDFDQISIQNPVEHLR